MTQETEIEKRKCCRREVVVGTLISIGIIVGVVGALSPMIFQYIVEQQLVLTQGSEAYTDWHNPPIPIYLHFYIFNYTNVNEILHNYTKPSVDQRGPYTYREVRINEVVDYNEYNITYLQNYSYVFEADKSCTTCEESEVVWSPSIVAMTLMQAIHKDVNSSTHPLLAKLVDVFLNRVDEFSLFNKLTVSQLIWGYEDKLLHTVKELEGILESIGFKLPPLQTFIALQKNGTAQADEVGNITMLTGRDSIKDVQRIVQWRGLNNAPYWLTKYGGMINGTDGSHAPPFLSRHLKYQMFVTDLCRSIYTVYKKTYTFKGIEVYQFGTTADLFINSTVNHDNAAFCSKERCWPSGLLPISACRGGFPIFMSSPHFYQGDLKLVEAVNGMHPNASLHSTVIAVEPTTGISISAYKRMQVNVMAQKSFLSKSLPLENEYNFLPVMFVCEAVEIDEKNANKLREKVLDPKTFFTFARFILIAVGASTVIAALILLVLLTHHRRSNSYKELDNQVPTAVTPAAHQQVC